MPWIRSLLFALAVPLPVLGLVPRWIVGEAGRAHATTGAPRAAAIALVAGGAALMLWCFAEFAGRGRASPAPFDPARRLVVRGPYRVVRNPMYVGGVAILVGQAMLYGAPALLAYAAAFALATHLFVVGWEEQVLSRRFGDEYAAYRRVVGRWIPRAIWPRDGAGAAPR